jgi:hypothetical protein
MCQSRIKVSKIRLKTYFLFSPLAALGTTLEMGFTFSGVHGHESILIPGKFIIKERLEELGVLREYMTRYHQWIGRQFATRFALSLIALSLSLTCFQARFQIKAAHPCSWDCED